MSHLKLFAAYGIELEYAIVDRDNLSVRPICDQILTEAAGELVSDFEDGNITWSNELTLHVIELKTTRPAPTLHHLEFEFGRSLRKLESVAQKFNCLLLPTAMHPLMHPDEMRLWPHDNNEVYEAFDRIFSCRGHGWANLQSMHINLPFATDDEFVKLHTAIRFLLPILPALSASSPLVEGHGTSCFDNRLLYYKENQRRIPSIAGGIVPEFISSISEYKEKILNRMYSDIAEFDPNHILREDWLNSRGAIARFERQSIEIRVLDIQEAPVVDLAIADLICATLKCLTAGEIVSFATQRQMPDSLLRMIYENAVESAEAAMLSRTEYPDAWNVHPSTIRDLWIRIFQDPAIQSKMSREHVVTIEALLRHGSLANRIRKSFAGPDPSKEEIVAVFKRLSQCLMQNQMYTL